jgi:hypothetical protein
MKGEFCHFSDISFENWSFALADHFEMQSGWGMAKW